MPARSRSSLLSRLLGFGFDVASSDDAHAVLGRRVSLYLRLMGGVLATFYVFDAAAAVTERGVGALATPGLLVHLSVTLAALGGWFFLRKGERSSVLIQAIEAGATLAICGAALVLVEITPVPGDQIMAGPSFAVLFTLIARASIVPSSGARTLFIGLVVTALASYVYRLRGTATDQFAPFVGPWTFTFVIASTFISRVIYGLERQVREARRLGQYILEEKLGEGGMGMVYRARHSMLRRPTAIKLLLPERAGKVSLARFEREVRQTARLSHPNTVTIYDYGRTPDGIFYYAMELLDGATLEDIVAVDGPQRAARVIRILARSAGALAEAHASGLVHRDIKPSNVMLCRQGGVPDVPKVLDFGLVKDATGDALLTQAQTLMGTPLYMSPESIVDPDTVDARSDLYALGAVGYFMLTARHVFEGNTVLEVCHQHLNVPPVPPSARAGRPVPETLERIVLACLEKDPAARPASAKELERRLLDVRDAGTWNTLDAERWWNERGPELELRRTETVKSETRTLAVDPSLRS